MKPTAILSLFSALVLPASSAEPNTLTKEEQADGFKLIFDGKSLEGFRGFKKDTVSPQWQVRDGAIVLTGKGGGDLLTKAQFANFEFRFEFKIAADGNSGIMWHVSEDGKTTFESGPEYQIFDSHTKTGYPHEIKAGNLAGGLYGFIPVKPGFTKPTGEWNEGSILVSGTRIKLTLNGHTTADVDTSTGEWKTLLAKTKFATWEKFNKYPQGHFAFQDHGDSVSFRSLRVRILEK